MSAYIVTPETIAKIAVMHSNYSEYQYPKHNGSDIAQKTAARLLQANIKSIGYRYPDTKGLEIESFFTDLTAAGYKKEMLEHIEIITASIYRNLPKLQAEVSSLVSEYIYQSCEYKAFYKSTAYITALEVSHNAAVAIIRGY